jgi:hypothetical protein
MARKIKVTEVQRATTINGNHVLEYRIKGDRTHLAGAYGRTQVYVPYIAWITRGRSAWDLRDVITAIQNGDY